jgi:hypothetical protein
MKPEKVKLKENVVSLYLNRKDHDNESIQRMAVHLSGMRDRQFPLMGEYLHARDGMVVVIEHQGTEWTLPAGFVEVVRPAKKRKCAA